MAQLNPLCSETQPPTGAPLSASGRATCGRILLVEDEERLRTVIRRALERFGYDVCDASDGPAALARVTRGEIEPDLLITDLSMPAMDGLQLMELLRVRRPELRVLLVSGFLEGRLPAGLLDPHLATLGKPFRLEDLAGSVRALLDA